MPPALRRTKILTLAILAGLLLLAFSLARLAFLARFEGLGALGTEETLHALYLGLKFDARLAALLLMPIWLLLQEGPPEEAAGRKVLPAITLVLALALYAVLVAIAMVDDRMARPWLLAFLAVAGLHRGGFRGYGLRAHASARRIWMAYAGVAIVLLLAAYGADFGTYGYIHTRLNGTLLMFLENPAISGRMVWESYPVVWAGLAALGVVAGLLWALASTRGAWGGLRLRPGAAWTVRVLITLGLLFAMYGKWSKYPLRWAEAFQAKATFHAHLALNPVLFLLETRKDMDGGYDLARVRATQAVMADYFGIPVAQDAEGLPTLLREGIPHPLLDGRPNVVFIQLESFAGFKTGILGNPLDPTPFFDSLCRKGILFDRFNVAMENTSRSMFASLFGIPDVSSVENATRNPLLLDQHSILRVLDDYDKSFFLGGSANWAQIRGILTNNFKDIALFEEGSYRSPVVDVWGICDADLLLEANARLRLKQGPFWSYIQTSGNHPPFTIPGHLKGFQRADPAPEALHRNGFVDQAEFNALRLMDYSLEQFFRAAEKEPYFRNTVFLLWGDHGLPRGSRDTRFGDLTLAIHRVPFLIYSPRLAPRRDHRIATQMDIMPTLASLLGRPCRNQTLGKDLLDPAFADKGAAFTFTTFRRPPRFGLLQGDDYLNLDPDGTAHLYRVDEPEPRDRALEDPGRTREMKALAQGFHEWSKFLLSHNKPLPGEAGTPRP